MYHDILCLLRQWQPTPVLLPGKSHERRSLVGCSPWGCEESDTTGQLHFHALEKEMANHSSVLAWRIPGTAEPGGLPSVGLHRVWHNWSNLAAAAAAAILSTVCVCILYFKPHGYLKSQAFSTNLLCIFKGRKYVYIYRHIIHIYMFLSVFCYINWLSKWTHLCRLLPKHFYSFMFGKVSSIFKIDVHSCLS